MMLLVAACLVVVGNTLFVLRHFRRGTLFMKQQQHTLSAAVDSAKVKHVKAGMKYKKNDPVELVVNKVG
jgi:hypothetical protein